MPHMHSEDIRLFIELRTIFIPQYLCSPYLWYILYYLYGLVIGKMHFWFFFTSVQKSLVLFSIRALAILTLAMLSLFWVTVLIVVWYLDLVNLRILATTPVCGDPLSSHILCQNIALSLRDCTSCFHLRMTFLAVLEDVCGIDRLHALRQALTILLCSKAIASKCDVC